MFLVSAAIAGYIVFRYRSSQPSTTASTAASATTTPPPAAPLGGNPAAVEIPPLEQSDPVVADLVRKLSSHPQVAAWLTTDGLVRNFAVVVLNISEGSAPSKLLSPLRPSGAFRVVEKGGTRYIDSRSYDRYNALADAVASIDPQGSATLYATLKPRLEEAHRELGELNTSFDRTLERAIVLLLKTPIPTAPVAVVPRGIGYGFADSDTQTLTAAQKQLLRMGPDNARKVQAKLRDIALALGIPSQRLPPGRS